MDKKRLHLIDTLRGVTMVSMILYHFCWDLKYINGFAMDWYESFGGFLWQQSICWSFILIAGFCFHLTKKPLKNGLVVFACGVVVTCVTLVAMPDDAVHFGVLTMIGSSILLAVPLRRVLGDSPGHPCASLVVCALLFAMTRGINDRSLNLFFTTIDLPEALYNGGGSDGMGRPFLTYLGFTQNGFASSDYFSLLPWFFLFLTGYFLYHVLKGRLNAPCFGLRLPFFTWFGRHSLVVYMGHQVVLYAISMFLMARLSGGS